MSERPRESKGIRKHKRNLKAEINRELPTSHQDPWQEIEAKTTKEAIKIALQTLKVKRKYVEIKILREEHKGLFGMEGAELAKIKVTVKKKT